MGTPAYCGLQGTALNLSYSLLISVCFLATQAFLLVLKHTRAIPTPGPLYLTFSLPRIPLAENTCAIYSLTPLGFSS